MRNERVLEKHLVLFPAMGLMRQGYEFEGQYD